jgi:malate dehydrogenase (oxaloacetate-decarboxylating)
MHDDVHGTAVVTLAAAIVACRSAGLLLPDATVGQIGLGAAGFGIASLFKDAGVARVVASDPEPASHVQAAARGIEVLGSLEDAWPRPGSWWRRRDAPASSPQSSYVPARSSSP